MKRLFLILAIAFMPLLAFSQDVLSVGDLLKFVHYAQIGNKNFTEILSKNGYTNVYEKERDTEFYIYKNCRLQVAEPNYSGIEMEAVPSNEKASYIYLHLNNDGAYISVTSFGKRNFNRWVAQLKSLGYKNNGHGGEGNHGRDWEYSKKGSPDLTIWNDYGTQYDLNLNFKFRKK